MHYGILVVGNVDEIMDMYCETKHKRIVNITKKEKYYYEQSGINLARHKVINDVMFAYKVPEDNKDFYEGFIGSYADIYPNFEDYIRYSFENIYDNYEDGEKAITDNEDIYSFAVINKDDVEVYCYTNPDGKWDWFVEGGRWEGFLITDKGACNTCLKKEFSIEKWVENKKSTYEKYWVEAKNLDEDEKNFKYGITKGMTKDEYTNVNFENDFLMYGIVKDGEWFSKELKVHGAYAGEMCIDEWLKKFYEIFYSIGDDERITVVDIHS